MFLLVEISDQLDTVRHPKGWDWDADGDDSYIGSDTCVDIDGNGVCCCRALGISHGDYG
jgi:hypothetical protein